jgi:sulfonate transport system substrate-binding protein
MILRYLEKNGLSLSEISQIYLPPADGRAALEAGSIDAWSIWDPYLAVAQEGGGYRELTTGKNYVDGREFYLASRRIVESQPQLVKDFLTELESVKAWAKEHSAEVNRFLAADTGIPLSAVDLAESRRHRYETQSMTGDVIASQQSLADRYFELGLLPKRIDVKAAVWDLIEGGGK